MVVFKRLILTLSMALPLMAFNSFSQNTLDSDETTIKVEVHDELATENQTFFAKLIINHPEGIQVDESSFQIDETPFHAQLLSQGKQSSISVINGQRSEVHQAISYYIFEVNETAQGHHTLPSVSVKVGDKLYSSEPVSYFVSSPQISNNFSLTAFVDAPEPLYPGQNFVVTYRVVTTEPMEVFFENLPLLDLKDCQKRGKQRKRVFYQGAKRVEEYAQTYQAKAVGSHQIEPSFLEARVFTEDFFGRRRYKKGIERAQSDALKLSIQEFPQLEKPPTFNGAVGKFTMDVNLDSSTQVCLGDKLRLKMTFCGKEGLNTIYLPNISEQVGFKDQFRFNDLPLSAQKEEGVKTFICELRPMKENITEIPEIEFSFFNPQERSYSTLMSQPLPITLLPMKQPFESITYNHIAKVEEIEDVIENALEAPNWKEEESPALIEIKGVYPLDEQALNKPKVNYHVLEILAALLTLALIQMVWKYFFSSKSKGYDSAFYLKEALKNQVHLQNYQLLLEKSLLLRLKEQKFIKEYSSVDQLGLIGVTGEVREYIQDLQMQLFSGQNTFSLEESYKKAKEIYKKIGDGL